MKKKHGSDTTSDDSYILVFTNLKKRIWLHFDRRRSERISHLEEMSLFTPGVFATCHPIALAYVHTVNDRLCWSVFLLLLLLVVVVVGGGVWTMFTHKTMVL